MRIMVGLLVLLTFAAIGSVDLTTTEKPLRNTNNCGYQSCHPVKEGFINVHLVSHTHDDVGWLKTVDQYYYGSQSQYQQAGVQYILDTVVESLRKDKNRRFIYVETAFFWKWWLKQHDVVKSRVRKLVNNGQLEFISGGWSMNDEAVTHYHSIIDQMTWGLRKLNDTFGECGRPKIGWQIDPFGHSKEMANIFAQLGFEGVLLGRIDYQEKNTRFLTKTPEMVWRGSESLGASSDIFAGVMYNTYAPPPGFCFDIFCTDEPIIDDTKSFEYNVDQRVDDFLAYVKNVSSVYATSNIIITMGNDFNYQDAEPWFVNIDKLIHYTNLRQANGSQFNLIYSTPSCYVKAIYDETKNDKGKWLLKHDDFFPYSSDPHAFWTGYFTSRPTLKKFERLGNNFLQICKQLYALTDLDPIDRVDLNALREAMGIMQHHDAVTGTEKQHVANDYARRLQRGIEECEIITNAALNKLIAPNQKKMEEYEHKLELNFTTCPLVNISQCSFTEEQKSFVVTVYNPLSRPVSKFIRLPVVGNAYIVRDNEGTIPTQMIPISQTIRNIPGRTSSAKNELIILAEDIPALGFKSYFVELGKGDITSSPVNEYNHSFEDSAAFGLDPNTGLIRQIQVNGVILQLNQSFHYYEGFVGDNKKFENRSSGAYIFRPTTNYSIPIADHVDVKIYKGELVAEAHQTFNEWVSQIIRVNSKDNFIEFDWLVGPIPNNTKNGFEIISKFSTHLATNLTFYTDSNGKEMLQRIKNFRPTWQALIKEPISGNYYPIPSKIAVKDTIKNAEFAVLTDRTQGGGSLNDGEVELMVHRNCIHDDDFGVGEALNEQAFGNGLVARGSHYITAGQINSNRTGKSLAAIEKDIAQRKLLDSWTFLSATNGLSYKAYQSKYMMKYSGLKQALPDNVQILTLEPWKGFTFLLRLEHIFEKNEDQFLSKPVIVNLKDLFKPFTISSAKETTLGANQWIEENKRLIFKAEDSIENMVKDYLTDYEYFVRATLYGDDLNNGNGHVKRETVIDIDDLDNLKIILNPTQIRTFIIEFNKN